MKKIISALTIILAATLLATAFSGPAWSAVSGSCANCHTMHNSDDGGSMVEGGGEAQPTLLANNCVGCHSSNGASTVVTNGGTATPIVLNHQVPTGPLAGGNFYWVEHGSDGKGHNVITSDAVLGSAPGSPACGFGGCHVSLASIRYGAGPGPLFNPITGQGCIGCHDTRAAHHREGEDLGGGYRRVGVPSDDTRGFRFLSKAGTVYWNIPPHNPPNVVGIEAPWSVLQNPNAGAHNEYQDAPKAGAPGAYMGRPQGISDFCSGCHRDYHSWELGGSPNGGSGNAWLRHPAGVVIPDSGEYAQYTGYDTSVPVARPYTQVYSMSGPSATVTPGTDMVMCLSCHFAHAGPYPDALRWDYSDMVTGTSEAGAGTGCFKCHTEKDGII